MWRRAGRFCFQIYLGPHFISVHCRYRAPEILLGSTAYTFGVDMWSSGCILGELIGGKPTFPGTSTMNQLDRIIELTGRPSLDDLRATQSPFAETMLDSLPPSKLRRPQEVKLTIHLFILWWTERNDPYDTRCEQLFPTGSDQAADLLYNLLEFNPEKRYTAEEALRHPYLAQFHNPADEPSCDHIITIPVDDNSKYTIQEYRERLYFEIVKRKKVHHHGHLTLKVF